LKKSTILAALLVVLLMAFTPLVLAQQTPPSDVPADSGALPSLDTPAPGSTVGCQNLYGFPTAFCQVNEAGLITLPDDSTAPVFVQPDGTAFLLDEETSILIPIGTSSPSEDSAGDIQYDNAQGEPPAPESPLA
jgi:hypothetical protein